MRGSLYTKNVFRFCFFLSKSFELRSAVSPMRNSHHLTLSFTRKKLNNSSTLFFPLSLLFGVFWHLQFRRPSLGSPLTIKDLRMQWVSCNQDATLSL